MRLLQMSGSAGIPIPQRCIPAPGGEKAVLSTVPVPYVVCRPGQVSCRLNFLSGTAIHGIESHWVDEGRIFFVQEPSHDGTAASIRPSRGRGCRAIKADCIPGLAGCLPWALIFFLHGLI